MNSRVFGGRASKLTNGVIELVSVAARKIGARRAVIGHEQGIADKGRVRDLVSDIRRRMTRRVDHFGIQFADLETFAILEQMIEIAAVGLEISCVKDRSENSLHVLDVLADADIGPGLGLDVGRARQMVGVRVGLERPDDLITLSSSATRSIASTERVSTWPALGS